MRKPIFFFAIIVIYLMVRFSDINKPLDYNGWSTAHSLITQQIWHENGIQNYNFSPAYTFNNQKDKDINNIGGIKDNQGNYYYISYPPFSFLLPFIIFKLFGIYPTLLPLNLFNIFLHVLSALLIYFLISLILTEDKQADVNWGAFFGFILYLFSPGNFWFYTNIYFVDILVNTIFIAGVYFILKIIWQEKFFSISHLLFLGILIFIGVYTEWLGLFFAFTILLYCVMRSRENRGYLLLFSIAVMSTVISIALILFQYSSISGFSDLIVELQNKYLIRGSASSFLNVKSYLNVIYFYKTYYFFEILTLIILSLIYFYYPLGKIKKWVVNKQVFLYFVLVPVVFHYLFFFNFNSNHSFSTLKTSTFLIVAISLLVHKLILVSPKIKIFYFVFLTLFVFSSAVIYMQHTFSNYGKYNYQLLATGIVGNSTKEENILLCNYPDGFVEPQVLYYSHRNIRYCRDKNEAKSMIRKLNLGQSVIFTLNQNRQIMDIERIND